LHDESEQLRLTNVSNQAPRRRAGLYEVDGTDLDAICEENEVGVRGAVDDIVVEGDFSAEGRITASDVVKDLGGRMAAEGVRVAPGLHGDALTFVAEVTVKAELSVADADLQGSERVEMQGRGFDSGSEHS
jgi:hypothetical protein